MSQQPPLGPRSPSSAESERRRIPTAARGPYLAAVREGWQVARDAGDARQPALALALATYAHDGRARGVRVETLLRALDTVVRPPDGEGSLDFGDARAWAGTQVIRGYYAADRAD